MSNKVELKQTVYWLAKDCVDAPRVTHNHVGNVVSHAIEEYAHDVAESIEDSDKRASEYRSDALDAASGLHEKYGRPNRMTLGASNEAPVSAEAYAELVALAEEYDFNFIRKRAKTHHGLADVIVCDSAEQLREDIESGNVEVFD